MSTIAERLIEQGIEQGIDEGIDKGVLSGQIQLLEKMLGQPKTELAILKVRSLVDLQKRLDQLQGQIDKLGPL